MGVLGPVPDVPSLCVSVPRGEALYKVQPQS